MNKIDMNDWSIKLNLSEQNGEYDAELTGSVSFFTNDANKKYTIKIFFTDELAGNYIQVGQPGYFTRQISIITPFILDTPNNGIITFTASNNSIKDAILSCDTEKHFSDFISNIIDSESIGIGFVPQFYFQIIEIDNNSNQVLHGQTSQLMELKVETDNLNRHLYNLELDLPQSRLYDELNNHIFVSDTILIDEVNYEQGINCYCSDDNKIINVYFFEKGDTEGQPISYFSTHSSDNWASLASSDFPTNYKNYTLGLKLSDQEESTIASRDGIKLFNFASLKSDVKAYCYNITKNIFGGYDLNETPVGERYLIYLYARQNIFDLNEIQVSASFLDNGTTESINYYLKYENNFAYYFINYSSNSLSYLAENNTNGNLYLLNDADTLVDIYLDFYDMYNFGAKEYNFVLQKNQSNEYFSIQNNGVAVGMLPTGTSLAPTFDISDKYITNFNGLVNVGDQFNTYQKGESARALIRNICIFRKNDSTYGNSIEFNVALDKSIKQVDLNKARIVIKGFEVYAAGNSNPLVSGDSTWYTINWPDLPSSYKIEIKKLSNYYIAIVFYNISNATSWPSNLTLGTVFGDLSISFHE